ncbi:MAG TPA: DUF3027 domain-containing protein [Pseudolysinimonas sp.]|nr:DUF3027 domain-containing protein [Pseudolysinimonas sp.]
MTVDRETLARQALFEMTPAETVGTLISQLDEGDGVTTLLFAAALDGYPGWHWAVSVAELPGDDPTVLETELMPGDGALLAPDWVPWSERLDEYRQAQAELAAAGVAVSDDLDPDAELDADDISLDDDVDDLDIDDDDLDDEDDLDDGHVLRRGGKRDGIEIDHLDDSADDEDLSDVDELPSDLFAVGEDQQDEAEAEADQDRP